MKLRLLVAAALTLTLATALFSAPSGTANDLVVHEWGTFLAMAGSDGVTLDGMYHEEHALPAFVHSRSKDQLCVPSVSMKGETPVIYFYTPRRQKVFVRVGFPAGLWTQWYPQAALNLPGLANAPTPPNPASGRIQWRVDLVPPGKGEAPKPPQTSSDALWRYSRQVDSAWVLPQLDIPGAAGEAERFIFYRGLGRADLPLSFSAAERGTLSVSGSLPEGVRHVFVIDVKGGRGAYKYIPSLRAAEAMTGALDEMPAARPMPEFVEAISNDLVRRLVQSGLFEKEARAMANTWRSSYFESEGIRALFVLPQAWTDRFIPMYLDPKPARVVRVMVGRIELLSKERERQAERAVQDLASSDSHRRSAAFEFLRKQGRYVEPVLRRIAATSKEPNVARMCRRLLLTDWITDLRAASRDAETGRELEEDPLEVRAQLAVLLRDAGLAAEAQEEGRRVIAGYSQRQLPPTTNDEARKHLRALARAAEAIGDDVQAKERYEEFIRFGAQTKTCGGCHLVAGPRDFGFFRDWWAGERYARVVERLGRTTADIVALEKRAATASAETSDRIRLAYLLKSAGRGRESDTHWAKLDGGRGKKLAATDR